MGNTGDVRHEDNLSWDQRGGPSPVSKVNHLHGGKRTELSSFTPYPGPRRSVPREDCHNHGPGRSLTLGRKSKIKSLSG